MKAPAKPQAPQVIEIFDRRRVRRNRIRAATRFDQHDFLFRLVADSLSDRLRDIRRAFPLALQIGGRGLDGQAVRQAGGIEQLIIMDCAGPVLKASPSIQAEEDFLPFADNSLDMVISSLALQSVNDLPGALIQINRTLKPDGLFLGALPGGETLYELRQVLMQAEMNRRGGASPRIAPFADKPQMGALMQRAGFALPVVDSDIITVTYPDIIALMHDIRYMGEGNALAEQGPPLTRAILAEAEALYRHHHAEPDGRLRASFEIIYLIGWAPHITQPKPLRPGTATGKLSDALDTEEISTGIQTGVITHHDDD